MDESPSADPAPKQPKLELARALDELYAYYERTEPMFSNVFRDLDLVDALQPTITPLQDFLAEGAATLTAGWNCRGRRRHLLRAALRHVLDFHTWQSLTADEQITRADAAEEVADHVADRRAPRRRRAPRLGPGRRLADRMEARCEGWPGKKLDR